MSNDEPEEMVDASHHGLRPHEDARAVVWLLQCAQCSYPIHEPMILPCGNSICRRCMPSSYVRANITYPQNVGRAEGFLCPIEDCAAEHSMADCSLDITFNKVVELARQVLINTPNTLQAHLQLDERLDWHSLRRSNIDVMPRSRVFNGGRVSATFAMANAGELDRHSKLSFTALTVDSVQNARALDDDVVGRLRDICLAELECHVCYGLFVDPITSTCGHTFCRKCIARVLDHTTLCPSCRRPMLMRPGVSNEPINKSLSQLISGLLPEELAARITSLQQEEELNPEDWMPLFPCTLAFPDMPAFLHIFEPRYRLMVRRCIENGSRKFGMVMYNSQGSIQGSLGRTQFSQYGTVLYVSRVEIFPDGRSLLETQGLHRFRVLEAGILDGYYIGRIQRIDDIPLAEEEAAEAFDMRGEESTEGDFEGQLRHMSTQALYQYCVDFVEQARARSADWLHERMLAVFGPPPQDPAVFPFWIASILPVTDDQKYALLPVTSVRERLKITARWIRLLEEASRARLRFLRLARLLGPELEASEVAQPEEHSEMTQPASQTTEPETEPTQPHAVHDSPPGADEHPALPSSEAQSQSETETEANDEN